MTGEQIATEVVAHRLTSICDEMMAALVRSAFSPNIKERRDCSTGIFDPEGNLVALAAIGPIHLSSLMGLIENVIARHDLERIHPSDCFITNDPYVGGGSHLPDITLVGPVIVGNELVGFVSNIAHHSDVGGKVAGSESADSTTIYQEGLRIPPVRLSRDGRLDESVVDFIAINSRLPEARIADLNAQLAAIEAGRRRLVEIVTGVGNAEFASALASLLDYSELRARGAIDLLPDGQYQHSEYLDNDGIAPRDVRLDVRMTVDGHDLAFDFMGTDPQVSGGRNMPRVATLSTVYYAVKSFLDPDIPPNSGYFRAVRVDIPEGSVLSAISPAAVGDRAATGNIVGDLLFGVLSQAAPNQAMAGCGPMQGLIFSGTDPRTNRYRVNYENIAGASGALRDQDGRDAVRVHISGAANLPVESLEQEYPLAVERLELIADSGGAGTYRGGLGIRRDVVVLADDARLAGRGLRQTRPASGICGGESGALGRFVLGPGDQDEERLPASFSEFPLSRGATVSVETPGGGGYGVPGSRTTDELMKDLRDGKVTWEAAAVSYLAITSTELDE